MGQPARRGGTRDCIRGRVLHRTARCGDVKWAARSRFHRLGALSRPTWLPYHRPLGVSPPADAMMGEWWMPEKKPTDAHATSRWSLWVSSSGTPPRICGRLHISSEGQRVVVVGDPDALRSLARLLDWIADKDQEAIIGQPVGERFHVRLWPEELGGCLVQSSLETELCRLDAKGDK